MSLQYIIDGYNLINHPLFARRSNKKIKNQRLALLDLINSARLVGSPKNKVIIVFDGYPDLSDNREDGCLADSAVNVVFSRSETADERIKKIAEKSANPKNTIMVSDDKELRLCIRSLKGKVLGVEEFICSKERPEEDKDNEIKVALSFTQRDRINLELKKLWLR